MTMRYTHIGQGGRSDPHAPDPAGKGGERPPVLGVSPE